ncbi:MAG: hypothetical protein VYC80_03150 [Planctomycetota bacterium]|nr:hypothetical protein [Planctomycetota bacterium]
MLIVLRIVGGPADLPKLSIFLNKAAGRHGLRYRIMTAVLDPVDLN